MKSLIKLNKNKGGNKNKIIKLPTLGNLDNILKESKKRNIFKRNNNALNEESSISSFEFNEFKQIGMELDIPEIYNLEYFDFDNNKMDIFLKYLDFHKIFSKTFLKDLKYYEKIEDLENAGYELDSHLRQPESIKRLLENKNQILLENKMGYKVLGVFCFDISVDVDYDEIIIIGNNIFNYFFGKGKITSEDMLKKLDLKEICQMMETNGINDIGIDPINEVQYIITAEVGKKNITLFKRPIFKEVITNLFNKAMIEMGMDHTTEMPIRTGVLKQSLITVDQKTIERRFRLNFIKIDNGLTLSIRRSLTYEEIEKLGLDGLSYSKKAQEIILSVLAEKKKTVILMGETNSGKSTLIYILLILLSKMKLKIISIENPAEIKMESKENSILQIDLTSTETADTKFKMTYDLALNGSLRHNPNVLSVGEIRSAEEIRFFMGLALRGHMAFTTFHTGSSEEAIDMFLKHVSENELRNVLNLFIHQELLPKVCYECNGEGEKISVVKGVENRIRCSNCLGSGSKGVVPVYEIVKFKTLSPADDLRNLKKLLEEDKIIYLSKHEVVEDLFEKGIIHKDDYERVLSYKRIGE